MLLSEERIETAEGATLGSGRAHSLGGLAHTAAAESGAEPVGASRKKSPADILLGGLQEGQTWPGVTPGPAGTTTR